MLEYYFATDTGKVRSANEDSGAILEGDVFVVADGMGGHAAGEIASRMLTDIVRDSLHDKKTADETTLAASIRAANTSIVERAMNDPKLRGMGTTATICRAANDTALFAHVGDSRIYRLRGEDFAQMTRDHSYVEELVRKGEITEAEARVHPKKNILMRAVGGGFDIEIDTGKFSFAAGDTLLLATDGLTNMVPDEKISVILRSDAKDPAAALVEAALDAGGRDNVTAIVVKKNAD